MHLGQCLAQSKCYKFSIYCISCIIMCHIPLARARGAEKWLVCDFPCPCMDERLLASALDGLCNSIFPPEIPNSVKKKKVRFEEAKSYFML